MCSENSLIRVKKTQQSQLLSLQFPIGFTLAVIFSNISDMRRVICISYLLCILDYKFIYIRKRKNCAVFCGQTVLHMREFILTYQLLITKESNGKNNFTLTSNYNILVRTSITSNALKISLIW